MTKQLDLRFDRREFIVAVGAVAVAYAPLAAAAETALPAAAVPAAQQPALLADWTIDDMWGVYPRYSEPIGYGRPRGDGELTAAVHPADAPFLV
jgi:hypothetical protein